MKKASMLLLCVITLVAVLVTVGLPRARKPIRQNTGTASAMSSNSTSIAPSSQENSTLAAAASAEDDIIYIVREYNGHIGVFRNGESEPFEEINIEVSIFPEEDRKLLRSGIRARGASELTRVLEDYEG